MELSIIEGESGADCDDDDITTTDTGVDANRRQSDDDIVTVDAAAATAATAALIQKGNCLVCSRSFIPWESEKVINWNWKSFGLRKLFQEVEIPPSDFDELFSSICSTDESIFCRPCSEAVKEVGEINQQVVTMELLLQHKVESLALILKGSLRDEEEEQEERSSSRRFRSIVKQNFSSGILPKTAVRMSLNDKRLTKSSSVVIPSQRNVPADCKVGISKVRFHNSQSETALSSEAPSPKVATMGKRKPGRPPMKNKKKKKPINKVNSTRASLTAAICDKLGSDLSTESETALINGKRGRCHRINPRRTQMKEPVDKLNSNMELLTGATKPGSDLSSQVEILTVNGRRKPGRPPKNKCINKSNSGVASSKNTTCNQRDPALDLKSEAAPEEVDENDHGLPCPVCEFRSSTYTSPSHWEEYELAIKELIQHYTIHISIPSTLKESTVEAGDGADPIKVKMYQCDICSFESPKVLEDDQDVGLNSLAEHYLIEHTATNDSDSSLPTVEIETVKNQTGSGNVKDADQQSMEEELYKMFREDVEEKSEVQNVPKVESCSDNPSDSQNSSALELVESTNEKNVEALGVGLPSAIGEGSCMEISLLNPFAPKPRAKYSTRKAKNKTNGQAEHYLFQCPQCTFRVKGLDDGSDSKRKAKDKYVFQRHYITKHGPAKKTDVSSLDVNTGEEFYPCTKCDFRSVVKHENGIPSPNSSPPSVVRRKFTARHQLGIHFLNSHEDSSWASSIPFVSVGIVIKKKTNRRGEPKLRSITKRSGERSRKSILEM